MEEDRIPAGYSGHPRRFGRRGPMSGATPRKPDCNVRLSFRCSAEPCSEEVATFQLDNAGCMRGREGSVAKDVLVSLCAAGAKHTAGCGRNKRRQKSAEDAPDYQSSSCCKDFIPGRFISIYRACARTILNTVDKNRPDASCLRLHRSYSLIGTCPRMWKWTRIDAWPTGQPTSSRLLPRPLNEYATCAMPIGSIFSTTGGA